MPPLPPTDLVLSALHNGIIPAAGAAALVLCLFLVVGRPAGALGSAAAVFVAVMPANYRPARAGRGAEVAAYLSLFLMAGGMLLLYAHTALFMEIAVLLGSAMFGIAVAAGVGKADTSGAIPAGVVFLPGLVLAGRPSLADNQ